MCVCVCVRTVEAFVSHARVLSVFYVLLRDMALLAESPASQKKKIGEWSVPYPFAFFLDLDLGAGTASSSSLSGCMPK